MKRSVLAAALMTLALLAPAQGVAAAGVAAEESSLSLSHTKLWPHPLDRREQGPLTVSYAVDQKGDYALLVQDRTGTVWGEQMLDGLAAGATGSWSWAPVDDDGVPLERGRYQVRLVHDADQQGAGAVTDWTTVASGRVRIHNSTQRQVIDDFGDGKRIQVDRFVLSNGPTRVSAGFELNADSREPDSLYAGFDVKGVPGGYYVTARKKGEGYRVRVLYTESLPGDAPGVKVRCPRAKLRVRGTAYEIRVPRACLTKAAVETPIRGFFGAEAGNGYDVPEPQDGSYWTWWTRATERGA